MITVSCKIHGFSLLFLLLVWGMPVTATPLPAIENLVEYTPAPDTQPCRGVQISEDLIASSPSCAQKAREHSNDRIIEIYTLTGEPVGLLGEQPDRLHETSLLLKINPDAEETRSASFPALYGASSAPDQAFRTVLMKTTRWFGKLYYLPLTGFRVNPNLLYPQSLHCRSVLQSSI